jgi:hypothetical protein
MSAKPVKMHKPPTAADTDAELISKQLRAKTDSLFKNFRRFDNIEELEESLNRLFSDAAENYAKASLRERERDPHAWVRERLRSDRDAIAKQNGASVFRIKRIHHSNASIEKLGSDFDEKLEFAMNEGLVKAGAYIDEHSEGTPVPSPQEQPQLRRFNSRLREAVAYFIRTNQNASDQEILAYLRENHLNLIPASWEADDSLPGKTFTKVRKACQQPLARH